MNLRPNLKRAQFAITLIYIILAILCIFNFLLILQFQLIQNSLNGVEITEELALENDNRIELAQKVYYLFYLISTVTFILWFRRAYFNLHKLIDGLSFTENWAALCWFIPFINLVRPYKIMKELYSVSIVLLNKNGVSNYLNLNKFIVDVWWTLWILVNILSRVFDGFFKSATEVNEIQMSTIFSFVLNTFMIILSFITIKMISDYSKIENSLLEINDNSIESIGTELKD